MKGDRIVETYTTVADPFGTVGMRGLRGSVTFEIPGATTGFRELRVELDPLQLPALTRRVSFTEEGFSTSTWDAKFHSAIIYFARRIDDKHSFDNESGEVELRIRVDVEDPGSGLGPHVSKGRLASKKGTLVFRKVSGSRSIEVVTYEIRERRIGGQHESRRTLGEEVPEFPPLVVRLREEVIESISPPPRSGDVGDPVMVAGHIHHAAEVFALSVRYQ